MHVVLPADQWPMLPTRPPRPIRFHASSSTTSPLVALCRISRSTADERVHEEFLQVQERQLLQSSLTRLVGEEEGRLDAPWAWASSPARG